MAFWPKLQLPLIQPLEVTGTSNFGKFSISYSLIAAPNFIKIRDGAVQGVADLTWNDPLGEITKMMFC